MQLMGGRCRIWPSACAKWQRMNRKNLLLLGPLLLFLSANFNLVEQLVRGKVSNGTI